MYNDGASFGDSLVQLGPVLRAVNASQQHQSYLAHIKEFTTGKEKEIEQLCKANYQVGAFVRRPDQQLSSRALAGLYCIDQQAIESPSRHYQLEASGRRIER